MTTTLKYSTTGANGIAAAHFRESVLIEKQLKAAGNITLDGATTINSTLAITGATTLDSTLDVTGNTTLSTWTRY